MLWETNIPLLQTGSGGTESTNTQGGDEHPHLMATHPLQFRDVNATDSNVLRRTSTAELEVTETDHFSQLLFLFFFNLASVLPCVPAYKGH